MCLPSKHQTVVLSSDTETFGFGIAMPDHIPEHARAEAARLLTLLRTFVRHDSDRGTVATNIAALADALLEFEQTLRVIEPVVNDCDGCGEPAARRVCDSDEEEFFICEAPECAEWAAPAQLYDTTDACWGEFNHTAARKHPRLAAADEKHEVLHIEDEENDDFVDENEEDAYDDTEEPTSEQAAIMAAEEQRFLRSHAQLWSDDEEPPM